MSARHLCLLVALTGCVDETGYEDDTGLFAEGTVVDDAANGSGVYYSSDVVLSSTPTDVTVLGLSGVIEAGTSATLNVVERPQAVPLLVTGNGFVGVVSAALDDTVQIRVGSEVVRTLHLTDDLSTVRGPETDDSDAAAGGSDSLDAPAITSGRINVGDGALPGFTAPYVVWVAARHAVAEVSPGDLYVTLPAQPGDKLCVSPIGSGGITGTAACSTL